MRRGRASIAVLVLAGLAAPAPAAADRFIATSGIPHLDIADVRGVRGWDREDGHSTSPAWEAAVDNVLAAMAAQPDVDATLMTGDLVAGYWGRDDTRSGIFGPVRTVAQRRAAVRLAARTYFGELRRDWAAHPGLGPVLPAVGDHEVGNLGPSGWRGRRSHPARMFPAAVRGWMRAFRRPPTYAVRLPGEQDVLLATLTPVRRTRWGIVASVGRRQLEWLEAVFRGHDGWKVIQVEIPPSPLPRLSHSSGTVLADGNALWATARELGVHVVFSAEVHALNAQQEPGREGLPGPVLVTNGGGMYGAGVAHFVVADVSDTTMSLTARTVSCPRTGVRRLWQTTVRRPLATISCGTTAPAVGTLTLGRDGVVTGSGGELELPAPPATPPLALPWPEALP